MISEGMLYNMDCIEGMKKHIASNSVDLIITDPPYGISGDKLDKHYNRDESFVVEGYVEIPRSEYKEFSIKWISEAERILRPGGSLFIVSGYTNLHHILNALHSTDLTEINHIIWKYNFGVYTKKKFISSHYHILFWQKPGGKATFNTFSRYGDSEKDGRSSMNYKDREDVFVINREYKPGEIKNKNELPYNLLIKLMQYCSNPGDVVCDMFLGGFSTAIVAKGLNRVPIGFEISKTAFGMGMSRFKNVNKGFLLDDLKQPEKNRNLNTGKPWTEDDRKIMTSLFEGLIDRTKGEIIRSIGESMGRGKWSISREIEKSGLWDAKRKKDEMRRSMNEESGAKAGTVHKKRGRPQKKTSGSEDQQKVSLKDFV